jgi:hypothetical protein
MINTHLENAPRLPHYHSTTTRYIYFLIGIIIETEYVQNDEFYGYHPAPLKLLKSVASLRLQSAG